MHPDTIIILLAKACVLVTLTFVLTRSRLFLNLLRPRLPVRDQVVATLVFLVMGYVEVAVTQKQNYLNLRVVSASAAGLLAGPWVGLAIGVATTVMAYVLQGSHHYPPIAVGISMVAAGLAGGLLRQWDPRIAIRPMSGFLLGALTSFLRYGLALGLCYFGILPDMRPAQPPYDEAMAGLIHGLSVALILLVVDQVRRQEAQARAAAMSEVRALQARMDPHFLFNSLNTLSALSEIEPCAIPKAASRLGVFLRASLDQHERPLIALREELNVVSAYLEVETLRFGDRLLVEQDVDPEVLDAPVPPFLLQPLVENAVRHGIQPRPEGGSVTVTAREDRSRLVLEVSDTGMGIAPEEKLRMLRPDGGHVHALTLLRRRLQALYGNDFVWGLDSTPGQGTTATVSIPLRLSRSFVDQYCSRDLEYEKGPREHEVYRVPILR